MLKAISAALAAAFLLQGCAVLPNTVGPELEHMSHATQHEPFTSHPTNYGSEILNFTAEWARDDGTGPRLDISEGAVIGPDEIAGPREQFSARFGWRFRIR